MIVLLLLACAEPSAPSAVELTVPLEGAALARRISIDVRGVVPSVEELERAEQGAAEVDRLREEWLASPAFESHLVDAFAEDWALRVDELRVDAASFGSDLGSDLNAADFSRAFDDEPARILARVAAEDRPWSDTVTVDWTMANDDLASLVPLAFTAPDGQGWREARYTDGRPAGGVLMTSGLWLRFPSTLFNYNRGRANTIARLMLCQDFLARPVHFVALDSTTDDAIENAVQTEPGCVACHASLDPIASSLFGFYPFQDKDAHELTRYHPERERLGERMIETSPGWYGTPIDAVAQLGPLVAADPRFEACAVRRTAARLWGREPNYDEFATLVDLQDTFAAGDHRYRALMRGVLATPAYRAGSPTPCVRDDGAVTVRDDGAVTVRVMSPATLSSVLADLTGFRWTQDGWDLLDSDALGFRVLLGGVDGVSVGSPNRMPSASQAVALQRVAEAAAAYGVDRDLAAAPEARTLLPTDLADPLHPDADLPDALAELHRRLIGASPTAEEATELQDFWSAAEQASDARTAWIGSVSLLLRDPAFWTY